MRAEGLTILPSAHGARETMDQLAAEVVSAGMTIFARVDHAAGADAVGMTMAPMEVLVFGAPKAGTRLLLAAPTIGIDLPLKALVWRDEAGTVWLAYNQPVWIAQRHGVAGQKVVEAMTDGLARLAEAAAD
jgi:uncharacterized protein (DUF302 family)